MAGDLCPGLLPTKNAELKPSVVTPDHLIRLRDVGQAYGGDPARKLFTFSPNRTSIAFQIHRADPDTNSYCVGLVVLPLQLGALPILIDVGRELIMDQPAWYGWSAFHIGTPATVTPRWLPNGQKIAYLKRSNASTQVWIANANGAGAVQITNAPTDVDDFRLSSDGSSIVYATRPGILDQERQIDRESLSGWHYDERAFPVRGPRPQIPATTPRYMIVDIESRTEREASEVESQILRLVGEDPRRAIGSQGRSAAIEAEDTPIYPPDYRLEAAIGAQRFVCPPSHCKLDRTSMISWTADGTRLIYTRREGWANSLTGIYVWKPGKAPPFRAYITSDALIECQPNALGLLCLRERSREPRHFVQLNLQNGKAQKLFDPNPEFGQLLMGRVERLNWRNEAGLPWYGDLVYPTGYQPGHRYPIVVVQYRTKGFLRGGTGDEVPVQTLAANGYFVLSVDNLTYEDIIGRQKNAEERTAAFNRNFVGRRHILSAIETMLRNLDERGLISMEKVGISGLSDGCTTTKFAALNSKMFAAGSVSGCGLEPDQDAVLGPMIAKTYHESGWPKLADNNTKLWSNIAFIPQPRRVGFPILFQAADNEYLAMVGSHTALRQVGTPSDLFVFPGEDHIKSQPAHRLSIYRRNLAWFDFWLEKRLPTRPAQKEEAARWQRMREEWQGGPEARVR